MKPMRIFLGKSQVCYMTVSQERSIEMFLMEILLCLK